MSTKKGGFGGERSVMRTRAHPIGASATARGDALVKVVRIHETVVHPGCGGGPLPPEARVHAARLP